jgi:hypothetical protein
VLIRRLFDVAFMLLGGLLNRDTYAPQSIRGIINLWKEQELPQARPLTLLQQLGRSSVVAQGSVEVSGLNSPALRDCYLG